MKNKLMPQRALANASGKEPFVVAVNHARCFFALLQGAPYNEMLMQEMQFLDFRIAIKE